MLADFDAQPNRTVPALPELSATQREADEAELYAGLRGVAGIVARYQRIAALTAAGCHCGRANGVRHAKSFRPGPDRTDACAAIEGETPGWPGCCRLTEER